MFFDWTFIILIPSIILTLFAQAKVRGNLSKFSRIGTRNGKTGADIAKSILSSAGIRDVNVEMLRSDNGDHYDPSSRTIRLSANNFQSSSITAVAVAAHEAGHAIQHNESYTPLSFRSGFFPVARFGSVLAWPMIIIGIFLASMGEFSMIFIHLGIILFTVTVIFHLVTLPVEFNASRRATEILEAGYYLTDEELRGAKKVLNAAALTYVAAAAAVISQLLRLLLIFGRRQ